MENYFKLYSAYSIARCPQTMSKQNTNNNTMLKLDLETLISVELILLYYIISYIYILLFEDNAKNKFKGNEIRDLIF